MLRGNVPTRISKCMDGLFGAIILARAGIERLKPDLGDLIVYELNPEIWLPAPGQGAIAIQINEGNKQLFSLLKKINDPFTEKAVRIERQILANFGGGCHSAFASYTHFKESQWKVYIGIEDEKNGWLQHITAGSFKCVIQTGPQSMKHFKPPSVTRRDELCWKIR